MQHLEHILECIHDKHIFIQTHNFPDPDAIASDIQFSRYVFECPFQGPQNRTISTLLVSFTCSRCRPSSMFFHLPDSLERR